MQRAQRKLGIFVRDQHRRADFRRFDDVNIDAFGCERFKHRRSYPCVAAHTDADQRDFRDIRGRDQSAEADRFFFILQVNADISPRFRKGGLELGLTCRESRP